MIALPNLADLSSDPFPGEPVVNGVVADPSHGDGPGRVRVEVDGQHDVLAFYGAAPEGSDADPVIFLRGDAVELRDGVLAANESYRATSPRDVQALCEQFAALFGRPYLHLARPGPSAQPAGATTPFTASSPGKGSLDSSARRGQSITGAIRS